MYEFCLLCLSGNGKYCRVWSVESRRLAWFIIHHYRAEDLTSKAALITLLTGCQANKIQNKGISKNVWNTWSHRTQNKDGGENNLSGWLPMNKATHTLPSEVSLKRRWMSAWHWHPFSSKQVLSNEKKQAQNKSNPTSLKFAVRLFSPTNCFSLWHLIPTTHRHNLSPQTGGVFTRHFTAVIKQETKSERVGSASPFLWFLLLLHENFKNVGSLCEKKNPNNNT